MKKGMSFLMIQTPFQAQSCKKVAKKIKQMSLNKNLLKSH